MVIFFPAHFEKLLLLICILFYVFAGDRVMKKGKIVRVITRVHWSAFWCGDILFSFCTSKLFLFIEIQVDLFDCIGQSKYDDDSFSCFTLILKLNQYWLTYENQSKFVRPFTNKIFWMYDGNFFFTRFEILLLII